MTVNRSDFQRRFKAEPDSGDRFIGMDTDDGSGDPFITDLAGMAGGLAPLIAVDAELSSRYRPGGEYFLSDYGTVSAVDGAANTTTLNAAHAAMYAAGGGVLIFPEGDIPISGQIVLPNDGGGVFSADAQLQPTYVWRGQGGFASGQVQSDVASGTRSPGGTRLILTYDGASYNDAKIVTRGLGVFCIEHMTLSDTTANADTPFLFSTNTTLKITQDVAFLGRTSGTSCAQDAIVLGGKIKPISSGYDDADSGFQGYGTEIRGVYFDNIRRAVYGRSYCNAVVVDGCFMDKGCGSNLANGACIEFDGTLDRTTTNSGDYCTSNKILNNYLNGLAYTYQVKLLKHFRGVVAFNYAPDPSSTLVAFCRLEGDTVSAVDYPSLDNLIMGNFCQDVATVYVSEDTMSAGKNDVITGGTSEGSVLRNLRLRGTTLTVPAPSVSNEWKITDGTIDWWRLHAASGQIYQAGPLTLVGNNNSGSVAGTTALTIGNNSTAADAVLNFNAPSGQINQIQFKRAGTNSWLFYDANSTSFFFRDSVNSKMHLTFTPGSGAGGGSTEVNSALKIVGNVGFYNTAATAKQTVTGAKGGNAALGSLLTALATIGLITDSSSA